MNQETPNTKDSIPADLEDFELWLLTALLGYRPCSAGEGWQTYAKLCQQQDVLNAPYWKTKQDGE